MQFAPTRCSRIGRFISEVFSRVGGEICLADMNDASSPPPPSPSLYPLPSPYSAVGSSMSQDSCVAPNSMKRMGLVRFLKWFLGDCVSVPATPKGTPVICRIPLRSLGADMAPSQMVLGRRAGVDTGRLQPCAFRDEIAYWACRIKTLAYPFPHYA